MQSSNFLENQHVKTQTFSTSKLLSPYPHVLWKGLKLRCDTEKFDPLCGPESSSEITMQQNVLHSGSTLLILKIEQLRKLPTPTPTKPNPTFFLIQGYQTQTQNGTPRPLSPGVGPKNKMSEQGRRVSEEESDHRSHRLHVLARVPGVRPEVPHQRSTWEHLPHPGRRQVYLLQRPV